MKILALDQGTTGTKAFTYDEEGKFKTVFSAEVEQHFPKPGWVEHDPAQLIGHIETAIKKGGKIDAIGIANQGETLLAWNAKTGTPIYHAIVWQDDRTKDFCAALKAQGAEALAKERAGLPLDPYFSASKFRWLLDNVPEAKELAAQGALHLGTSDAFFLERLTGQFVTDVTTASRTSLMNLDTCLWDDELCALFGVPRECLPEIRATTGPFGGTVTASMVDQQAALFGHGCMKPGDAKITFGTGAFALALVGPRRPVQDKSGLLPTVAWKIGAVPADFAMDGGVYNAASAVNWAKGLGLFKNWDEINSFEKPSAISRGLAFVPALSGLAAPHWDRNAAGLWLGLGLDTSKQDMMQAVLEGVALRACEVMQVMERQGAKGNSISIDGGLSKNPYFGQFLATALNRRVVVSSSADLTGLGIARMAMLGAGAKALPPLPQPSQAFVPLDPLPANLHSRFGIAVLRAKGWKGF
jgi:glycerol kinase